MQKLKTAVIGVGYLGRFHAQKYAALADTDLVAVVDASAARAAEIAAEVGAAALTDYRTLYGQVDAVSIATPTSRHYEIARDFLTQGAHVLVEKPITVTLAEAEHLIELAEHRHLVLQVGHLERFNAALMAVQPRLHHPLFIESHRLAPFNPRGMDVNVVLDLMIHDIDIILSVLNCEIARLDASGAKVLSDGIDIANARLVFENGCVANVTASRVALKAERKMRFFQTDSCFTVDFQRRILQSHTKGEREMYPGIAEIVSQEQTFANNDAIKAEIEAFLHAIRSATTPVVSGVDGKRALATALRISEALKPS